MAQSLKISQLAKLTGVTADTIRYYEKAGVLPPASRSATGYRQYGDSAVQRLRFIRRARALGLPLSDLKALSSALNGERRAAVRPRLLAVVEKQLSAVRAHRAELRILQRELQHVAHRLASSRRMNRENGCNCLEAAASSNTSQVAASLPMSRARRNGA
jgi:DNA-binding transcriptional MerR regulator